MMNVFIDGLIYGLQKTGGITRYANEIAMGLSQSAAVTLFLHNHHVANLNGAQVARKFIGSPLNSTSQLLKYITYPLDHLSAQARFFREHMSGGVFHSTYYTRYRLKVPQVITVHDLIQERMGHGVYNSVFLEQKRRSIKNAAALICVSKQTAADLERYYNVRPSQYRVIHSGVSSKFRPQPEEHRQAFLRRLGISKPYLLHVGYRSGHKNFDFLLKAFATWRGSEDFLLVAVGGGAFNRYERRMIRELALGAKLVHFDYAPDEVLIPLYSYAEFLAFPSLYEGFGFPLLEAMACGTKVVGSDIPVFHELAGNVPVYFDPRQVDSLTAAFDEALALNGSRRDAGIAVARSYPWDHSISAMLSLYESLANQERRPEFAAKFANI